MTPPWPIARATETSGDRRHAVCVENGGTSRTAAGLIRDVAGDTVAVESAGTEPGSAVNAPSAGVLLEAGVDIADQTARQRTDGMFGAADRFIVLGRNGLVGRRHTRRGVGHRPTSERGADGVERMRLIRDDLRAHVRVLVDQLGTRAPGR